jgi:hypothetical protein
MRATLHPPRRNRSMSSIESAPVTGPATIDATFAEAFAPPSPPSRTRSSDPLQATPLRQHRRKAGTRHQNRHFALVGGPRVLHFHSMYAKQGTASVAQPAIGRPGVNPRPHAAQRWR